MTLSPASSNPAGTVVCDDALRLLDRWLHLSDSEEAVRQRIRSHLAVWPRTAAERTCPEGHLTASTMLVRVDGTGEARTLLTLHPRFGRWMQLGGHVEPGESTLEDVALRETLEESGQDHPRTSAFLGAGAFDEITCSGQTTSHFDFRFLVLTDSDQIAVSDESLDLAWWPLSQLPDNCDDDLRLLARQSLAVVNASAP